MAKDTHTLRTFFDGYALTLRFAGDTAHFELWIPGEEDPEPLATIPALGGVISWAPTAAVEDYAGIIRYIVEKFAALPGDRRRYSWNKKWNVWDGRFC
jgi:hypothetical protein